MEKKLKQIPWEKMAKKLGLDKESIIERNKLSFDNNNKKILFTPYITYEKNELFLIETRSNQTCSEDFSKTFSHEEYRYTNKLTTVTKDIPEIYEFHNIFLTKSVIVIYGHENIIIIESDDTITKENTR